MDIGGKKQTEVEEGLMAGIDFCLVYGRCENGSKRSSP